LAKLGEKEEKIRKIGCLSKILTSLGLHKFKTKALYRVTLHAILIKKIVLVTEVGSVTDLHDVLVME
jgi:hypothetical protein